MTQDKAHEQIRIASGGGDARSGLAMPRGEERSGEGGVGVCACGQGEYKKPLKLRFSSAVQD